MFLCVRGSVKVSTESKIIKFIHVTQLELAAEPLKRLLLPRKLSGQVWEAGFMLFHTNQIRNANNGATFSLVSSSGFVFCQLCIIQYAHGYKTLDHPVT